MWLHQAQQQQAQLPPFLDRLTVCLGRQGSDDQVGGGDLSYSCTPHSHPPPVSICVICPELCELRYLDMNYNNIVWKWGFRSQAFDL